MSSLFRNFEDLQQINFGSGYKLACACQEDVHYHICVTIYECQVCLVILKLPHFFCSSYKLACECQRGGNICVFILIVLIYSCYILHFVLRGLVHHNFTALSYQCQVCLVILKICSNTNFGSGYKLTCACQEGVNYHICVTMWLKIDLQLWFMSVMFVW
jgi:hypothetical protein